jgi:uncharacterized protein
LFALAFIGPLIIMRTIGKRSPFVRYHAAEALNFHITVVIVVILIQLPGAMGFLHSSDDGWFLLLTITIAFLLPVAVLVAATVFSIIAAVRSHEGRLYRYPLTLRLVNRRPAPIETKHLEVKRPVAASLAFK